ncbi:hypothetical protein E2C01_018417 [Portunus trituberculatus]|uniref:Uncharacterized protein n=1 Tax=Portunus trituberculatus TaxID=210409 RepID=A0A5B7DUE8_PORTR|nr:hypothetical protein [Portunus trituberculatus]
MTQPSLRRKGQTYWPAGGVVFGPADSTEERAATVSSFWRYRSSRRALPRLMN